MMGRDAFVSFSRVAFLFLGGKRWVDGTAKESRLRGVPYGWWDWGEMQKRNVQTAVKLIG